MKRCQTWGLTERFMVTDQRWEEEIHMEHKKTELKYIVDAGKDTFLTYRRILRTSVSKCE